MIWQPNKLSNDKLFSQYNSEESIIKTIDYQKMAIISESGGIRGGEILFQNYTKSETDEAMTAIELFKNNNFEKSKQILIALSPKEKKNNELLLFLAIAQLKTNEVKEAISNLEHLNAISNYEFADEVKFRLALGYINQNKKSKAKDFLVFLVGTNNKYSNTAQEILDNLRWF
jgi:predicted Zn-dependent protease